MIGTPALFSASERSILRHQVVALWWESFGLSKAEIAFRLNLSVPQLEYVFPLQLESSSVKEANALVALFARAKSGDGHASLLLLAATLWDQAPFSEMLMMPDGARCS